MIKDMNAEEAIRHIYLQEIERIRPFIDLENDAQVKENYAGSFITACQGMMNIANLLSDSNLFNNQYKDWTNTFISVIDMCILAKKEPMYVLPDNYEGNTFRLYDEFPNSMYVIHHMNQFIDVQTIRLEPLLWIELGNKVGITDIKL